MNASTVRSIASAIMSAAVCTSSGRTAGRRRRPGSAPTRCRWVTSTRPAVTGRDAEAPGHVGDDDRRPGSSTPAPPRIRASGGSSGRSASAPPARVSPGTTPEATWRNMSTCARARASSAGTDGAMVARRFGACRGEVLDHRLGERVLAVAKYRLKVRGETSATAARSSICSTVVVRCSPARAVKRRSTAAPSPRRSPTTRPAGTVDRCRGAVHGAPAGDPRPKALQTAPDVGGDLQGRRPERTGRRRHPRGHGGGPPARPAETDHRHAPTRWRR